MPMAHPRCCTALMLALMLALLQAPALGQILQGDWVDQTQKKIDALRKTELRVLVLDAQGNPAGGAAIKVDQVRQGFDWGVRAEPAWFATDAKVPLESQAKVWRNFTTLGLEPLCNWPELEPEQGQWNWQPLDRALKLAREHQLRVRLGPVVSADVGRWPAWVATLPSESLQAAIHQHAKALIERAAGQARELDLQAELIPHDGLRQKLGPASLRGLYYHSRSLTSLPLGLRFPDAFAGQGLQQMTQLIKERQQEFVPVDYIALDLRLTGQVLHPPLQRSVQWLESLEIPVVITALEVGGPSPAGAAINLETALRTLYASKAIQGIQFASVVAAEGSMPHSALVDEQGQPTRAGSYFDSMIQQVWSSDLTLTADALGQAKARVYSGLYELTADLPGNKKVSLRVQITPRQQPALIVLQPLKGEDLKP